MTKLRKTCSITLGIWVLVLLLIRVWPEADYKPYVADEAYRQSAMAFPIPPMPEDWKTAQYKAEDGALIHYGWAGDIKTAKATILIVPGYTSNSEKYGDQYEMLKSRGYQVAIMDLRGHGRSHRHRRSHPEKLYVKDFQVLGDDVAGVIGELTLGGKPLIVMGSSLGGAMSTRALIDHDLPVDGLLLLAPAFQPSTEPFPDFIAKVILKTSIWLGKSKHYVVTQRDWRPDSLDMSLATDCGSYPERLYIGDALNIREPALRVGGMTNGFFEQMLKNGQYIMSSDSRAKLNLPITTISAQKDVIVEVEAVKRFCVDGVANCHYIQMPETGHCLMLENDNILNQIYDEADRLLTRL